MQPEMPCGWSRLVDGPLGKQGVKGTVKEFSKEEEGIPKGACPRGMKHKVRKKEIAAMEIWNKKKTTLEKREP
jgi:hypothetical protein